jgi:DNA-directed RNA polymerase subunit M/transcription elongation factor TFIIS
MIQQYLPCPECGGPLHPRWFDGGEVNGKHTFLLDMLVCSYCGHREVTSDMTPAEYKSMIASAKVKELVEDDDGR